MLRLALLAIVIIIIWINILPYIMPNKPRAPYSDEELREIALSRGMSSIPKEYNDFIKLSQTSDNPITKEKVALGKELFFDKELSIDKSVSCATCHMLAKNPHNPKQFLNDLTDAHGKTDCMVCHIKDESGSDRLATAIGAKGEVEPYHRNTLTILNSSLAKYQMWDASSKNSFESIKKMIVDPYKMGLSESEAVQRVDANTHYKKIFKEIFGDGVSFVNIQKAIDAYQKTLVTRSPYDDFLDGNNSAMSQEAKRGFRNFIELGCKGCHTGITVGGQTLQKFPTRDYNYIINVTGVFNSQRVGRDVASFDFNFKEHRDFPFENIGGFLGKKDEKRFRVPILRNITKTSPYFHNGAVFDLREAIYIMGKYQLSMELSEKQIDEIMAFFKALEGEVVEYKELK
ncbi:cytochrome-c peroxidase [Sulfurimonas sp.]